MHLAAELPVTKGRSKEAAGPLRDGLYRIVKERAYREGSFILSSGKQSPYYFDGKKVLLDPEGSRLFAAWLLSEIDRLDPPPVAIGGLEIGAIPIACVAMALSERPLRTFIVRKRPKVHGTGNVIEGDVGRNDRVIVVDDVITTGESTLKAIQELEKVGCEIVGIYCLVDREEGHLPEFDSYRRFFQPAFTISDFRHKR